DARSFGQPHRIVEVIPFLPAELPVGYPEQLLLRAVRHRCGHSHFFREVVGVGSAADHVNIDRQNERVFDDVPFFAGWDIDSCKGAEHWRHLERCQRASWRLLREVDSQCCLFMLDLSRGMKMHLQYEVGTLWQSAR